MKNRNSNFKKQPPRQKIFLAIAFLLFSCFILSITLSHTYLKKQKNVQSVILPNYQKLFKQAILEYESAESASIYKDEEKARRLLESSRKKAKSVISSPDLSAEAKELLGKIEEEEKKLEAKTDKDQ